jgi:sulfatase maturation enzyme AslB (radical SAM superfamily)
MKLNNTEIRIENTNLCNGACTVCPREQLTRQKVTMGNDHFALLANQAKDLGAEIISIFGYGEPLLDSYLPAKVKHCSDQGLETFVTTNASLLDFEMAATLLWAGLDRIRISVHGIIARSYNTVHRKLNFKEVMKNIHRFKKLRDKHRPGCQIEITVLPMHAEHHLDIRAFWAGIADELEIWKPHNWAYGRSYRKGDRKKPTCGRPWNGPVQINSDGNMMVCCFDFDGRMTVGNTYENTIEEILKGEAFEEIRGRHRIGNFEGVPCETCDQLHEPEKSPLIYSSIDDGTGKSYAGKTNLKEKNHGWKLHTDKQDRISGSAAPDGPGDYGKQFGG